MNLFDRDFFTLTAEEVAEWREQQRLEVVQDIGGFKCIRSRFRQYPSAIRHNQSLFPNQYLDAVALKDEDALRSVLREFADLLNEAGATERILLNFIRARKAYFIVGSLLKSYFTFGHHDAHLFLEFPLGTTYKVDYLLLGKSSDGWHLVFVEFEAPRGQITLASGDIAGAFRKGLGQIADWNAWLEAYYGSLAEVFDKCRQATVPLPQELRLLDKSRINFVVIAGRRSDFNERTYRTRRTRAPAELILHYDNLMDAADAIIGRGTY